MQKPKAFAVENQRFSNTKNLSKSLILTPQIEDLPALIFERLLKNR